MKISKQEIKTFCDTNWFRNKSCNACPIKETNGRFGNCKIIDDIFHKPVFWKNGGTIDLQILLEATNKKEALETYIIENRLKNK